MNEEIVFCDLGAQLAGMRPEIERAINEVLDSTAFINGPAVRKLEDELSDYVGSEAIGCASGTDALLIALMALEVQPGDEIIVPDFTFIATAEVVALLGAKPVFCDVDPLTYNMNPECIEPLISTQTVGIIPVSIFGQCADFDAINAIAEKHSLWVMEDAAQSFGAEYKGRKSCSLSPVATSSFFPAKPLGCYGDGGVVFASDPQLAKKIRMILNHGQNKRYHHAVIGVNARLDSLQAAIVSVKLQKFDQEIQLRQQVAASYSRFFEADLHIPVVADYNSSVWAQYTLQHPERDAIRDELQQQGIPTAVHYPVPLHTQEAFAGIAGKTECPVTEKISRQVFSLPMHPYLPERQIEYIAQAVLQAAGK